MANLRHLDSTLIPNKLENWSTSPRTLNDSSLVSLVTQIGEQLRQNKTILEIDIFLKLLPLGKDHFYLKDELLIRAQIALAFERRNYPLIYNLIESHNFRDGDELVEIWDKAHYAEEEHRTQKPLTALKRFRIRKRYIPPENICPTGKRKKSTLPDKSKHILQAWMNNNIHQPYPSKETKENLSKETNLTPVQVGTWFVNARRRYKRMGCDEALSHAIRSYRLQCLENKTNGENATIGHTNEDSSKDSNKSSSNTDDNIAQSIFNTAVVSHHSEPFVSCQVTQPDHTGASSSHLDENETNSVTSRDALTMAPLELAEPLVSVGSNIPYGLPDLPQFTQSSTCTPASCAMWNYTPCCMYYSNPNTPSYNGLSLPLEPFFSAQCNFQQIVQNWFGKEKPDLSPSQDLYEQLCAMTASASEKEPLVNCHQQTNMLNQLPMCPQYSGTQVSAHGWDSGMASGSSGRLRHFDAATALLDMSVDNSSSSEPSICQFCG